jgi:O-antigen ligase
MLQLLVFVLLFYSFVQPLHLLPWVSWHSEVIAFLAVMLMAWCAVLSRSGTKIASATSPSLTTSVSSAIHLPMTALPMLGLALLVCAQYFAGLIPFFGDALVYCLYCLLCLTAMALGYRSAKRQDGLLLAMAATVSAAAVVSAFIALSQAFDVARDYGWIVAMPYLQRPGANLGQPNQLATLLLMGFASVVFLCEFRKLGRVPSAVVAFLLIASLAATESRAGALGFGVLLMWWFFKRKTAAVKFEVWHAAVVGIAYLCLFQMWPIWMADFFQVAGSATATTTAATNIAATSTAAYNRWIIWPQLVQAILLRPWFGWGVGQVSAAHNAVVDTYPVSEPYTYAHNIVLDLALGVGLPLTLLLVLVVSVWLWRRVHAVKQLKSWYCVALIGPVAVHSLVEFPFAYAYFLVPVMFALGSLEADLGTKPAFQLSAKSMVVGLSVGIGLFIWLAIEYVRIEEDFRIVRFEALRIGQTPSSYERPSVYLLTQLDALLHGGRIVPRPNMPMQEIELARTVALRFPWPATQNRYALSLALNGNPVEASRQLRVMRAQHGPKSFAGIKAAWTLLANERYPELHEIQLPVPLAEKID